MKKINRLKFHRIILLFTLAIISIAFLPFLVEPVNAVPVSEPNYSDSVITYDWDKFESPSNLDSANYITYTTLTNLSGGDYCSESAGIVTCTDPRLINPNIIIRIDTATELYHFSNNVSYYSNFTEASKAVLLDLHYVLGADIDYSIMGAQAFKPIGYSFKPSAESPTISNYFTGIFDGQGFEIKNLYVTAPFNELVYTSGTNSIPLSEYFSMFTINAGIIQNLGLINPTLQLLDFIPGVYRTSNLVGLNHGNVNHVYIIDNRALFSAGIRYVGGSSSTTLSAAGIVHTNDNVFEEAYYYSPSVIYASYSYRFLDVQPILFQNVSLGASENLVYVSDVYVSEIDLGFIVIDIDDPSAQHTGKTEAQLRVGPIDSETWLDTDWKFYSSDTMPLLLGLDYNEAGSYYEISNAIDLVFLFRLFGFSSANYNSLIYRLTSNIDMGVLATGAYKTPVQIFSGTFSGLNATGTEKYIISNLSINQGLLSTDGTSYHLGLFGKVSGTVENLILDNYSIELVNSNNFYSRTVYIGSVAGELDAGYIINVMVNGTINLGTQSISKSYVGGIVGKGSGYINKTSVRGTINGNSHTYDSSYAITPLFYLGGIVGAADGNMLTLDEVVNHADLIGISSSGHSTSLSNFYTKIGGIIGYIANSSTQNHQLVRSSNFGNITAGVISGSTPASFSYLGGIFGEVYGYAPILNSGETILFGQLFNYGNIIASHSTNTSTIKAAGIGVSNTTQAVEYWQLSNRGSFDFNIGSVSYDSNPKLRFVATIYPISSQNITLNRVYNYANFIFTSSYYANISPFYYTEQSIITTMNYVENKGNITVNGFTLAAELSISGITTNTKVNYHNVVNSGSIAVYSIDTTTTTSRTISVSGITKALSVGRIMENSVNYGNIIVAGISGSSNVYIGGLVNSNVSGTPNLKTVPLVATIGILNSINEGDISTTLNSSIWGITGTNNTFAGGLATMNSGSIQNSANIGNITISNRTRESSSPTLTYSTDVYTGGIITAYKAGVVVGGVVAITLNGNSRIYDTSNSGDIIAQAARYSRAGGILGVCLQQEASAGSVTSIVDGVSYLQGSTVDMTDPLHIKNSIVSNGLNLGNISAITETFAPYNGTSTYNTGAPIYRSYGLVNQSNPITSTMTYSTYEGSAERIHIKASAGGVIAYGLSVMTKMLNHGTIISTDVAGGIIGATYVLGGTSTTQKETIVEIDTAINYGNIEAINASTYYESFLSYNLSSSLVKTNIMQSAERTSFLFPTKRTGDSLTLRELPESRRGFGGIFGRLQRGGNGTMLTGVFDNIINANSNIDLIGRLDQNYMWTYSAMAFQFLGSVYFSAKQNDTTQAVFSGFNFTQEYVTQAAYQSGGSITGCLGSTGNYRWNITVEKRKFFHQGNGSIYLNENTGTRTFCVRSSSRTTVPSGYAVGTYLTDIATNYVYLGTASIPWISETETPGAQYIYGQTFIDYLDGKGLSNYIYYAENELLADRFRTQRQNGMYVLASSAGRQVGSVLPANISMNQMRPKYEDQSDIIFSEYIEGTTNRALELYNSSNQVVNLEDYTIYLYQDGATSPSYSYTLTGNLGIGQTYVLGANLGSSTDAKISLAANASGVLLSDPSILSFSGNDTLILKKDGEIVDSIGKLGENPGSYWGNPSTGSTQNFTMVRKSKYSIGRTSVYENYNPADTWDFYPTDYFDLIGSHKNSYSLLESGYSALRQTRFNDKSELISTNFNLVLSESGGSSTKLTKGTLVGNVITFNISLVAFKPNLTTATYYISEALVSEYALVARSKGTSESYPSLQSDLSSDLIKYGIATEDDQAKWTVTIPSSGSEITIGTFTVYSEAFIGDPDFADTTKVNPTNYYTEYTVKINFTPGITDYNQTKINSVVFNGLNTYTNLTNYTSETLETDFRNSITNYSVSTFGSIRFNFIDNNNIMETGYDFKDYFVLYYDVPDKDDVVVSSQYYSVSSVAMNSSNQYQITFTFDKTQIRGGTYYFKYSYFPSSTPYTVYFDRAKSNVASIENFNYFSSNNTWTSSPTIAMGANFDINQILPVLSNFAPSDSYFPSNMYAISHNFAGSSYYAGTITLSPFSTITAISQSVSYVSGKKTITITYSIKSEDNAPHTGLTKTITETDINLSKVYINNNQVLESDVKATREATSTRFSIDLGLNSLLHIYNHQSSTYPYFSVINDANDQNITTINGITVSSSQDYIYIDVSSAVTPGTYVVYFLFNRTATDSYRLAKKLTFVKLQGVDAYIKDINFSTITSETVYPDIYISSTTGSILNPQTYNPQVYFSGVDYNGSNTAQTPITNYRIVGYVSRIPLDNFLPNMVQYLPIGATIQRYYYYQSTWRYTPAINLSNLNSLINDPAISVEMTGKEWLAGDYVNLYGDQTYVDDSIVVKYRVTSENGLKTVDYFISVVDLDYNVSMSFRLYYCTLSSIQNETCTTKASQTDSGFQNELAIISVKNYRLVDSLNNEVYPGATVINDPANFPQYNVDFVGFLPNNALNSEASQFIYTSNVNYNYTFGRNVSGFYVIDIKLPLDVYHNKLYGYIIRYKDANQVTRELNDFGMGLEGKYFYINASTRNRSVLFDVYIYPLETPTDKNWGLVDYFKFWE